MKQPYPEPEEPNKRPDGAEVEQPAPCKHEWKQYFERPQEWVRGEYRDIRNAVLKEDGFFCIHCLERRRK